MTAVALWSVAEQVTVTRKCRRALRAGVISRWRMSETVPVTVTVWWATESEKP